MGTVSRIDRFDPAELINEKDIENRYPGLFVEGELSELRKAGKIGHVPFSRQRIFYRPIDIEKYLQAKFVPPVTSGECEECPEKDQGSSNTKANGSDTNQGEPDFTDTGCTDALQNAASYMLEN